MKKSLAAIFIGVFVACWIVVVLSDVNGQAVFIPRRLQELTDVSIGGGSAGQVLTLGTAGKWVSRAVSATGSVQTITLSGAVSGSGTGAITTTFGAIAPSAVTGTAATLGANTFTGNQAITGANLTITGGYINGAAVTYSGALGVRVTGSDGTTILRSAVGKSFTSDNTITLSGTDGSTLAIGTGGTLGNLAFQNAVEPQTITLSGAVVGSGTGAITTTLAAVAPSSVTGTAAVLGANTFTGIQSMGTVGITAVGSIGGLRLAGGTIAPTIPASYPIIIGGSTGLALIQFGNGSNIYGSDPTKGVLQMTSLGVRVGFGDSYAITMNSGEVGATTLALGGSSDVVLGRVSAGVLAIGSVSATTGTNGRVIVSGGTIGKTSVVMVTIDSAGVLVTTGTTPRLRMLSDGTIYLPNLQTSAGSTGSLYSNLGIITVSP